MKPEDQATHLLAITRSKAKMFEFHLPEEDHIVLRESLENLLDLTIGVLGDISGDGQRLALDEDKQSLMFSAEYFDALLNCRSTKVNGDYLRLLGACAYYLNGYPGSAQVLARDVGSIHLEANDLEKIILLILTGQAFEPSAISAKNPYASLLLELTSHVLNYRENGTHYSELLQTAQSIRMSARKNGSDRELLFADLINALCSRYTDNSLWKALAAYSGLDVDLWKSYIQTNPDVTELWPAQLLLGEKGVLRGRSSVVQMPTSAGKTKASELIIRAAILSGRSNLSLVVAPFRALCQEIYNTLSRSFRDLPFVHVSLASDVFQLDLDEESATHEILILTPEKLDYLLRHNPDIANYIGLIIYDEGHLFDDEARGVKYELLLTSLKMKISPQTQVVLVSAVIPNAQDIGMWLIGESCVPVEATHLTPTTISVAFASWRREARGRLEFVSREKPDVQEFFVPWLLSQESLELSGHERLPRMFPAKYNGSYDAYHIAISLGCRLAPNGSIAIFTGRKDSATNIADEFVEVYNRGAKLDEPILHVAGNEVNKLVDYVKATLGEDSVQGKAARLGVFVHHGSTPHGLRLCIEHALQKQHANFVICTSTLAQGVNLPIRCLLVTNDRQGRAPIKTRDFRNLMGRAGRAGMYTEGTVLFADPRIYDGRRVASKKWRWQRAVSLIDPSGLEPCKSHILTFFDNEPIDESELELWLSNRQRIRAEIESYLLNALLDISEEEALDVFINELVTNTLAYTQADESLQGKLCALFSEIGHDIFRREPLTDRRRAFAKAVGSMLDSQQILEELEANANEIVAQTNETDLFRLLWPIIAKHCDSFPTTIPQDTLFDACNLWLSGSDYTTILTRLTSCRFGNRRPTIDRIVDLCENSFGFQGSLVVASCLTLLSLIRATEDINGELLMSLQKRLRYGLPNALSVRLYEIGLCDRNLAQATARIVEAEVNGLGRSRIIRLLYRYREEIASHIAQNYPDYFSRAFSQIVEGGEE